jgi:membrane fusion protein (multidrug efflux system)
MFAPRLTWTGAGQTMRLVRDGEHLDTAKSPPIPTVQRRPRLAGRVLARAFMWSLPLLVAAITLLVWLSSGRTVATDNAYVKGDRAQIATELSGIIVEVPVQENQRVSRGQLLFRLDDQSYRHALTRIDAEIETTRADIRGLRAQWRTKREEIKAALSQQTFAQAEFDRQSELAEKKVASTAKLEETRMGLDVARQRISAAQEDLQRIEAQLAGDPKIRADDHPRVRQMMAAREEALLQLRRTMIESPLDGIVSKRPVPGSYATAGVPVMVVVADTDLWIEANFKETELTRVRAGQKAVIHVDTYPDARCTGTVQSIAQATGAEFAVLPPQNASGNWVKVVQRIPVRVAVACREGDPPLRVGMSTTVEIDTGHTRSLDGLLAAVARSLGLASASATPKP